MSNQDYARKRAAYNRGSRTNKPLASTAELDGIAGEMALAHLMGKDRYKPQVNRRTAGYQILHQKCWRIKVQTSRTPFNLLVKEGGIHADVYVLAGISGEGDERNVVFHGWADSSMVRASEVRVMTRRNGERTTDYELPSHAIPRGDLRPMVDFCRIMGCAPDRLDAYVREPEPESEPEIEQMGRLL